MKKIFLILSFFTAFVMQKASAQALTDTTAMQAASTLYQFKAAKNGVPISPVAPLAIHQRADNKLEWIKALLQGQITNNSNVIALKANVTDVAATYATQSNVALKLDKTDTILSATRLYFGGVNQFLPAAFNSPLISTLALHINGNGKQAFFGDNGIGIEDNGTNTHGARNVVVGEYANTDGDVLELHGKSGIMFSVGAYKTNSSMESGWKISGQASNAQPVLENYGRSGYKGGLKINEIGIGALTDSSISIDPVTKLLERNAPLSEYMQKSGAMASHIAYVRKNYTGSYGGASWQAQMNAAVIGNPFHPFPTVYDARKVMAQKLVSLELTRAKIEVLDSRQLVICEDTDASGQTGVDYTYRNLSANMVYHPYPSTTTRTDDDSLCASVTFPNLEVYFHRGSGINHVAGRGAIVGIWDTVAPQRVTGNGNFRWWGANDRTNSGNGIGSNMNMTVGYSKGELEFSGDSLKVGRLSPTYSGWAMMSSSAEKLLHKWAYVSTYENNSLFRGGGGQGSVIEIDRFVTDTTVLPYMYANAPYSPTSVFLNNGGYGCNVYIQSAYVASNPLVNYGFYGVSGQINFRCDKIEQKFRSTYQTELIGSAQSTTPQAVGVGSSRSAVISWGTWSNTHIMKNFTLNINVGSYVGQNTLFDYSNPSDIRNASIHLNFGSIKQDSNSIYPKTSISINQSGGTIDSSVFVINANILNFNAEALKVFGNPSIKFNGTYKTNSAVRNAIWVNGVNNNTVFDGSAVVRGTQASMEGTSGSTITCLPSSTANTAVSSNVTVTGTLNVNSAYKQ